MDKKIIGILIVSIFIGASIKPSLSSKTIKNISFKKFHFRSLKN